LLEQLKDIINENATSTNAKIDEVNDKLDGIQTDLTIISEK